MGFTADSLIEALITCSGGELDGLADEDEAFALAEIAAFLRHGQPSFAATVLSAWQAEGRELSPAMLLELDAARARVEYYRSVNASVTSKVPGLSSIKGLEIVDLYPGGLARHMNDLDYVASAESDLWQATDYLMLNGWELHTATFSYFGGSVQVMVSLRRPNEDLYQLPYGVELTTYYSPGNYGAIRPLVRLEPEWRVPAVKNILMLLYERYEQRFRARDLVDAVLLHGALGGGEVGVLHDAVVRLGLGVEYGELTGLVDRAGLGPLPPWPGRPWATGRVRAGRAARGAGFFLRPLAGTGRVLQRRLITGELGRAGAAGWEAVQRRLPVPAALSGGLLAFGLPLEGPAPRVDRAVLCRRGNLAWADTPVGRFLLTIGDYVSQDEVDDLTSPGPAAAHAGQDGPALPGSRDDAASPGSRDDAASPGSADAAQAPSSRSANGSQSSRLAAEPYGGGRP